jgi:hypothetical protein
MILQKDILNLNISGTTFRSKPYANPQFVLDENALVGYEDGVNVKRTEAVRPNQWGDFAEPGLLGSRNLTLTGTAIANSASQLHEMRDEFASILSHGGYEEIAVENINGTRYLNVSLGGSPSWVQKIDTAAVWKLELYAPDPRMYGFEKSVQITDGSVSGGMNFPVGYPVDFGGPIVSMAISIDNNGNTTSWPVFKVTGNYFSGFKITDGLNKSIVFDGVVSMESPVYIDTGRGTATQNGVDKSSMLSTRDWFGIPPNSSIAPRFFPNQDAFGWCDIMYRDTWI